MATNHNYENDPGKQRQQMENEREKVIHHRPTGKKLGIALVGLGKYSEEQLAPALMETRHCYLAGIVTGSPQKIPGWKAKYDIPDKNIYNYSNFDQVSNNPDIDILYIVLPNALHAEYVVKGAKAGKHIICEKPMAVSVRQCDEMIKACRDAGKLLSIGYRLHFEPHHRDIMKMGQSKIFGSLTHITAKHGSASATGWRLDKSLAGGGPLMDLGIYCIQAARYTTGLEPTAITATEGEKTDTTKFKTIEESLTWEMEFPGNLTAACQSSYSSEMNVLHADAEHGWFELSPAYEYGGINGKTATGFMDLPNVNQQALQMDDFAHAVLTNSPVKVPGEMGRADVRIMEAVYEAMRTKRKVVL